MKFIYTNIIEANINYIFECEIYLNELKCAEIIDINIFNPNNII